MIETHLLQDLAVIMAAGAGATLLCHRLKQPVVLGYLLAGLLVGPHTPPFALVKDIHSIHTLAELGLVFLMFSLGLEFNLPKLRRVGLSAALAAGLEVAGMLWIGYRLGQWFGWTATDNLFLGAILSISSTTIIVKVFMDLKLMKEDFAQAVFGILILEDIVAILILSVLSGLGAGGAKASIVMGSALQIGFFVVLFLLSGLSLVPRLIHWVSRFESKEVLGIVVLGLCLMGSLLAALFGFSVALGAFLTGAVIAASREMPQIEEWIHPVRDMFSAIFFVSAGMLIQPQLLVEYKWAILAVTLVTLAGKIGTCTLGSFLAGYRLKTSFKIGASLAQIGEFSFVIASLGASTKLTSAFLYPLAVTVSSLTTLTTPYLIRYSDPMVEGLLRVMPARLRDRLDQMQLWKTGREKKSSATPVFSKYLIRLVIYGVIFVALLSVARALSQPLSWLPRNARIPLLILWSFSGLLSLPLFAAISKYANHLLLLLATRNAFLLRHMNIHLFYRVMLSIQICALGLAFLASARPVIPSPPALAGLALIMGLTAGLGRRPLAVATERMEGLLDEVLGLATSEPTRQAVLDLGGRDAIFHDITDQVALGEDSPAVRRTIRDLRIRELTGASIVAIYRQGQHIANPAPDTQLLPDDVLVVLGEAEECRKARESLA